MTNVIIDVDTGAFANGSVVVVPPNAPVQSALLAPNLTQSFTVVATDGSDNPVQIAFTGIGGAGSYKNVTSLLPAGPLTYSIANTSSTFSFTPDNQFTRAFNGVIPIGTAMTLAGSVPTGFTGGTTYYVVSSAAGTFSLSATRGGSAISATTTGQGTATVTRYLYSGLSAATPATLKTFQAYGTPQPGYEVRADVDSVPVWTAPVVRAGIHPSDLGVIAWTASGYEYSANVVYTSASWAGKLILWTIKSFNGGLVSNINLAVDVVGNTMANSFFGIYDMAGNLLATTADVSASLTSGATGKTFALTTPVNLAPNTLYRIGHVFGSATTAPTFCSSSTSALGAGNNIGLSAANLITATISSGLTALPATFNPASLTAAAATPIIVLT